MEDNFKKPTDVETLGSKEPCKHDFHKDLDVKRNLVSKTCTKCGEKTEKPKGQPWEVCTRCWGKMKYLGKTPGQGGDGWHVHECEDCGHEASHT